VAIGLTTATNVLHGTLLALARVENLRFVKPVFPGDRVSVSKAVIAVEPRGPERGLLSFDTRVRNQRGEIVIAFVDRLLVKRGPADADCLVPSGAGAAVAGA
jgi:acyl dehydratase